ncbi:MAG TPA: DUF418 domain-containing protein [Candidatus Polarisedimenticolia bacterium]|nr:DUF418 domain-containing protein [Candidatus Polarisedimenticolia bacterium]
MRRMIPEEPGPEAPAAQEIAPVTAGERISSVDVLRGVALLGILLMNVVSFGLPEGAYADPTVAGGEKGANLAAWLVSQVLFEGKMRAIFSMLFGAGVVLLTSRAEARGGEGRIADIYYRRCLWLIAFGLAHAYFIWPGDILYGYGVVALLLFPFRRQSAKFLIVTGLLVLAVIVPKTIFEGRHLASLRARAQDVERAVARGRTPTEPQREALKEWAEKLKELKPPPADIAKEIRAHRAGYWTLFARRAKEVVSDESTLFYKYGFLDAAGMMLLGMGLLKLGVFSAALSPRFYQAMALLGYGIGAPINWYVGHLEIAGHFDPVGMFSAYATYDLGRLSVALGHVAVVMLICKAGALRFLTTRLAAVGQMALSNYLAHSILCVLLFDGTGFGLFGRLQRIQLLYVVLPIWAVQLLVSPIVLRRFRFGPLEWLWRSLTYWQRQPLRLT